MSRHYCPNCTKSKLAIARVSGSAASIVVCLNCKSCLTPEHGLSQIDVSEICSAAIEMLGKKAASRLTLHKTDKGEVH